MMDDKKIKTMKPWYNNFKGEIIKTDDCTYDVYGKYDILDANRIIINELPLGWSTTPYKEFLETIQYDADSKKNVIVGFTDNNTDERVHFAVSFPDKKLSLYQNNDTIETKLKLIRKLKTSNMNLFNEKGRIQTFNNVEDILDSWYYVRLGKYDERKEYLTGKIENELDLLKYKSLFIKYVLDGTIVVFKQKKQIIIDRIIELKFPELSTSKNDDKSYDYIINLPLFHLTLEKIEELNDKLKEKEKELAYVKTTLPVDVWRQELQELLELYNVWHDDKVKEFDSNVSGNVKITKLKKKTSIKRKTKKKKNGTTSTVDQDL
jgi:DNA topoisomerase-2